ncbi:MAG TPA: DegT/DnrJ/EryC1/StrS family aminotransferase [Candidatus Sulfotelmatobacter sp.]|nr:DegT/DnrJ/EryC1/StrS family aminotransferase [Candidatus Sulfotelmatobacter sp.]
MSDSQNVPFLDLISLHQELEDDLLTVVRKVLRTASFIGGPMVEEFERDFARFCESAHCVGVSSGTDAVRFALMASGVGPGDIVLTVPSTFIATTEAITQAGARADFVDVNPRTYNMDPDKLRLYFETYCTLDRETGRMVHRTLHRPVTAVVPVHLYGQMVDMDPILEIAARYRMVVIEDACQAHGAEYFSRKENRWRKAGSMGHAAAFSFYPGKNLGACGEAGAVTTSDPALAQKVRMLRDHGQARKYYHDMEGYNGRLDSIQAGMLHVKLGHLTEWNQKRREAATRYGELLNEASTSVVAPHEPSWSRAVYHLYVVRSTERDQLQAHLSKSGIGTGIHYPVPVHLQKPYRSMGYKEGDFPVAESAAEQVLSVPMYPGLTSAQQNRVVEEIARFERISERSLSVQPAAQA